MVTKMRSAASCGSWSVTKPQIEPKPVEPTTVSAQPLSPSVRRHLGRSLRSFYSTSLSEPVSERMEALLARLDGPKS